MPDETGSPRRGPDHEAPRWRLAEQLSRITPWIRDDPSLSLDWGREVDKLLQDAGVTLEPDHPDVPPAPEIEDPEAVASQMVRAFSEYLAGGAKPGRMEATALIEAIAEVLPRPRTGESDLDEAWADLEDALPDGWFVSITWGAGSGRGFRRVTAMQSGGDPIVDAEGDTLAEAVADLTDRLRRQTWRGGDEDA